MGDAKFSHIGSRGKKREGDNVNQTSAVARLEKLKSSAYARQHGSHAYADELSSDPSKIGFAFGGVDPGKLHAGGKLVDTHKVHNSIARCSSTHLSEIHCCPGLIHR